MARTDGPVGAQEWVPPQASSIDELKSAAADCKGCELYANATQTVFGRGNPNARLVFVGEQPGDMEDRSGLPFVGPAGALFDAARTEVHVSTGLQPAVRPLGGGAQPNPRRE